MKTQQKLGLVVYVGLGSNMGEPEKNLALALEGLALLPGVRCVAARSLVYRTQPQEVEDQPFFCNQVVSLSCCEGLEPLDFLDSLLGLEADLGRVRGIRFGPRVIDLDLLLFGNTGMKSERLTLPHPRMLDRAFVLVPLAEIAPELILPGGLTPGEALARLHYSCEQGVILQDIGARTGHSHYV